MVGSVVSGEWWLDLSKAVGNDDDFLGYVFWVFFGLGFIVLFWAF